MYTQVVLLLDTVFPRFCCSCGWIGCLLCSNCYEKIEFSGELQSSSHLSSVQAATQYGETTQAIIHTLKYQNVKEVAVLCARIIYLSCNLPTVDLITAIPLHHYRLNERGFNQAEVISQELSQLLSIPYQPLVLRPYHTEKLAQTTSRQSRRKVIEAAFTFNSLTSCSNKTILLVDDVWTTGATLNAAAQVLVSAGAKEVHGVTFTHGV